MNDPRARRYERDIREYLLGRLSRDHTTGDVSSVVGRLPNRRIESWWMFEGKRYRGFPECLALELHRVDRLAQRLRGTHNPHWRYVQAPEGEVDWPATAFATAVAGAPEYVCNTSRIGLSNEEHEALAGWLTWLARRWKEYVSTVDPPVGAPKDVPWATEPAGSLTECQLRRWARAAKRSRWPLLRNVVAETLRCVFEPDVLRTLPLPSENHVLFELACIVRILRAVEDAPRDIRWLNPDTGNNTIRTAVAIAYYQRLVRNGYVLGGAPFDAPVAAAVERFGVRVPELADALIQFEEPMRGFRGVLLEAKSGTQSPDAALLQLLSLRGGLQREGIAPLLVIGVVEEPWKRPEKPSDAIVGTLGEDLWLFATYDELSAVLHRAGLSRGARS